MDTRGPQPQKFYILATSSGLTKEALTLKNGDSFALFDPCGDIIPRGLGEQGLYHLGTRFLSRLELLFCNTKPFVLNSSPSKDGLLATADLTNPDILLDQQKFLPRGSIHLLRQKFLYKGVYFEAIRIENFSPYPTKLPLTLLFEADFRDIFEVRGLRRKHRGHLLPPLVSKEEVQLRYLGLDGITRETRIFFSPQPHQLDPKSALFFVELAPKQKMLIFITVECLVDGQSLHVSFSRAFSRTRQKYRALRRQTCLIRSSNPQFDAWLDRSLNDIFLLLTQTPYGLYPYAGIPWFSTVFGRDGLITALECLWINPHIAQGVLRFLAATQATSLEPDLDAEPGKIIHEIRFGELANTGEIPFGRYYGTIDATPLFIVLAGAYLARTRDLDLIRELWPHIEMAWQWMETYGDADRDGFLEYLPSQEGLTNKGWKDSHDSVFHADGHLAQGPIALVEVQAYAYQAYIQLAFMASFLGRQDLSELFLHKAQNLKERIIKHFWSPELKTFALALDGGKHPCLVRNSNAGHVLWSGLAPKEIAAQVTQTLFEPHMFSGWGVRTLSSLEVRYNPVSYHNGSIWPHDNAFLAQGLGKYGFKKHLNRLLRVIFEASVYFHLHRLPELFCGFSRRPGQGPTPYPVACNPQAWAAGAVFWFLEACLGLEFKDHSLYFRHPSLPSFLKVLKIRNLSIEEYEIDFDLVNHGNDVTINVLRKPRDINLVIVK